MQGIAPVSHNTMCAECAVGLELVVLVLTVPTTSCKIVRVSVAGNLFETCVVSVGVTRRLAPGAQTCMLVIFAPRVQ